MAEGKEAGMEPSPLNNTAVLNEENKQATLLHCVAVGTMYIELHLENTRLVKERDIVRR